MAQYFFNVQNMKMIFILAAGLYSWNFIRKQRQNNQQSKSKTKNQKLLKQKLKRINLDECSTDQIYQIFKGIDQNKKLSQEQNLPDASRQIGQHCNGQNNQKIKQQQDIQAQLNKILSDKLMKRIQRSKPLEELKNEWTRKWGVPVPNENQQQQQLSTNDTKFQHLKRIKPSHQSKIRMQDAICNIQFSNQDDSFQFFPPIRENPSMDIENYQDSILERVILRTNIQCLKLADRLIPKQKKIFKDKYKTTPKKRLQNKDKFNNTATPKPKESDLDNEKTERKNKVINVGMFSREAPPIQLLYNKNQQCTCKCGAKAQKQIIQQDMNKMQDQTLENITIPNFPNQKIQKIVKTSISYQF